MLKSKPIKIWTIKQTPNKEPKFHIIVILLGVGKNKIKFWNIVNKGFIFFTPLKNKKIKSRKINFLNLLYQSSPLNQALDLKNKLVITIFFSAWSRRVKEGN